LTCHLKAQTLPLCRRGKTKFQSGFTLIEVMVALVIFGASTLALTYAMTETLRSHRALESRQLAQWIANNTLVDLRTAGTVVQSGSNQLTYGHRDWLVSWTERDLGQSNTGDGLQQIQVSVHLAEDPKIALYKTLAVIGDF
jgi:type II secretion system protein I